MNCLDPCFSNSSGGKFLPENSGPSCVSVTSQAELLKWHIPPTCTCGLELLSLPVLHMNPPPYIAIALSLFFKPSWRLGKGDIYRGSWRTKRVYTSKDYRFTPPGTSHMPLKWQCTNAVLAKAAQNSKIQSKSPSLHPWDKGNWNRG